MWRRAGGAGRSHLDVHYLREPILSQAIERTIADPEAALAEQETEPLLNLVDGLTV